MAARIKAFTNVSYSFNSAVEFIAIIGVTITVNRCFIEFRCFISDFNGLTFIREVVARVLPIAIDE